jgi:hypothetical protein
MEMIARDYIPGLNNLTVIVDKKDGDWRLIDGNHRLIAALLRRLQKKPMKIKYVGVLREVTKL